MARSGIYLPTLDGWRAVAISMVILCHGSSSLGLSRIRDYLGTPGVDVFFGLSGFLITTLLLGQEAKSGSISLSGFYRRRLFRIMPAALAFLVVIAGLGAAGLVNITPGRWISALFFMANYSSAEQSWYVAHFWSLAVEEHFYLIWPTALILVRNNRARLALAMFAITFIDTWRMVDYKFHLSWSGPTYLWMHRTDVAADGILFGVVAALALADEKIGASMKRLLQRPLIAPVAIAIFALTCILPEHVGWKTSFILISLRSAVVPVMILATLSNPTSGVGRFLELRPLRFLGLISYSLYLWQELFLTWDPQPSLTTIQWFPANFVLTFVFATASFYVIETPLIRLGQRFGQKPAQSSERPVTA